MTTIQFLVIIALILIVFVTVIATMFHHVESGMPFNYTQDNCILMNFSEDWKYGMVADFQTWCLEHEYD